MRPQSTVDVRNEWGRVRGAVEGCRELAGRLEKGQAQAPIGARADGLRNGVDLPAVRLTIVPLNESAGSIVSAAVDAACLRFAPTANWQVTLAEPLEVLVSKPAAYSRLLAETTVLIVAGPLEIDVRPQGLDALRELSASAAATCLALVDAEPHRLNDGWPSAISASLPVWSPRAAPGSPSGNGEGPGWFNPQSPVFVQLHAVQVSRGLEGVVQLLQDACEQDVRQAEGRRKQAVRRLTDDERSEVEKRVRDAGEEIRRGVDDQFNEVERGLGDVVRQRGLPNSTRVQRLEGCLSRLSLDDFSEERKRKTVVLKPHAAFVDGLVRVIQQVTKDDQEADRRVIDVCVQSAAEFISSKVSEVSIASDGEASASPAQAISTPRLDYAPAESALREMLFIDPRYQGEMPARSWLDRLSYGRRPVFGVMMLISIVGYAVGGRSSITTALGPLLALLFLGGVVSTFWSFRRERQELLDRELARLKESLTSEARRLYESLLQEWNRRASRILRDAQRDLLRSVDEALREIVAEAGRRQEQQRREAQVRIKSNDAQLAELRGMHKQISQLKSEADALRGAFERALRAALNTNSG